MNMTDDYDYNCDRDCDCDYDKIITKAWSTYLSNDKNQLSTFQFGPSYRYETKKKREITKMGIDLPIETGYKSHLEETINALKRTNL